MPEARRTLSYVFSLHWMLNRRVHSLSQYLTVWNTWMNYSCFKLYSGNAFHWTHFFHNAFPIIKRIYPEIFKSIYNSWVILRSSALMNALLAISNQVKESKQSSSPWFDTAVEQMRDTSLGDFHVKDRRVHMVALFQKQCSISTEIDH